MLTNPLDVLAVVGCLMLGFVVFQIVMELGPYLVAAAALLCWGGFLVWSVMTVVGWVI